MAKKTRRARKATVQAPIRPIAAVETPANGPARAVAARPAQPLRGTAIQASVNFRDEYSYVASDLRRVFILAACMFAALIILSFII
jgi:hypothetical protein